MTRSIELDCGHVLWFEIVPDTVDEMLWCSKCDRYVELAGTVAKALGVWVLNADEQFQSKRLDKHHFIGKCTVENCDEFISKRSWFALRDHFHIHAMRKHTRFGALEIKYQDTSTPNSVPPF